MREFRSRKLEVSKLNTILHFRLSGLMKSGCLMSALGLVCWCGMLTGCQSHSSADHVQSDSEIVDNRNNPQNVAQEVKPIYQEGAETKQEGAETKQEGAQASEGSQKSTTGQYAIKPTGDPEKDWIFVQQAVDAWLYFHLSDFKSYEPIRRSNDFDSVRGVYIHHLRYRSMNKQGGMVTVDRDYEVDLNRKGENGNPFYVKEL